MFLLRQATSIVESGGYWFNGFIKVIVGKDQR